MTDAENLAAVTTLPEVLMRTSREIASLLEFLQTSRTFLENAAVPRLQRTQTRLHAASSTTETATHDLLDGLGRSLLLIDELGTRLTANAGTGGPEHGELHAELRDEVHRLVLSLQFQDIVAQQIGCATRLLQDTERRMTLIAEHFDSAVLGTYPHAATMELSSDAADPTIPAVPAADRQALADAVFAQVFPADAQ